MSGKFVTLPRRLRASPPARWLAPLLLGALLLVQSRPCHADSNVVKGIVGGGMLGAEAVLLTESALRLRPRWAYLVGGAAGAGAGAYLGYRIGDGKSNKPPAFLLAGGIALVIPTIMGVLTATQYALPEALQPEDEGDGAPGDSAPDAAPSDADEGARLWLPNVGLAQAFSREELALHGVRQATELHLSLLRGVF